MGLTSFLVGTVIGALLASAILTLSLKLFFLRPR